MLIALLPGSGIDGIVLDYNLGMNNDNVLTHEVGHYLGLDHTWGGSGGCGNDDGFGDTPATDGPSFNYPGSCSGSQLTCPGIQTQYENYMDYANCTVMFTQNQADYMLSILQGIRGSLLLSPGCDPTNTPPNSAFISMPAGPGPVVIPVGGAVSFTDQSINVPTGWAWTISGTQGVDWNWVNGTNQNSQDPDAEFLTVGLYDVTLTASNAIGADATPAIEIGYVQVVAPASGIACDTLRNWDPADADLNGYYYYNADWGYSPGHGEFCGAPTPTCYGLQYAEKLTYVGSAEARSVAMPFFIADDQSGTGTMIVKIWADAAGVPGAELATETINIADIDEGFWNEFEFTTPTTVTGTFWAGFELFYGATQDTILVGMTDTQIGGNDSYYIDINGFGWYDGSLLGITGSIAIDVMLSNGPTPIMDFTASIDEVCVGGEITVNGSGSANNIDYRWYVTDEPWVTTLEQSFTAANTFAFPYAPGSYNIYLFGSGSCYTDGVYLPVTVNAAVAATVTPTATTCGNNNGTITVTAPSGGDGVYYYSLDGVNYQVGNTFSNLASGDYDVYVATFGDNCEAMYTVTVNASTPATATVSPNASICPGGSATISATGGGTYQWFDGVTMIGATASLLVSPSNTTQYACLVTDGSGCQITVFTTVTVNTPAAAPIITASGPTTICAGSDVDLTSSYPTSNTWSTSETSSTITVSTAGPYTVTYTDGNGCLSTSAPINITVNPTPAISAGTVTDPSTCATATGSIQVTGSGTGDVSWTGTTSGSAIGVTLPYVIPTLPAGSYNITFTDGIGCVSNLLSQALNDPTPPATPTITPSGATTFCAGGSVTLTSSYGTSNTWSTSATTTAINVTSSGSYSVTYTDGFGCSATSAPTVVTVNNNPTAPTITPSGATTFCAGGSVNLTSSQGTGNAWSTSETTQVITVNSSNSYTVTYTNVNGCSTISAPIVVTVNPLPTAPVISAGGPITFCDGESVTLTSSQPSGNVWSTSESTSSIVVNTGGNITVTYTDGNGCSATSTTTVVTVNSLPVVDAGLDQEVCEDVMVTLSGAGALSYTWDLGVIDGVGFAPTVGTSVYEVTGTDANGCENTDQVTVIANPLPTVTLAALGTVCINHSPSVLAGESPAGGTFSGTGVTGGSFDPSVAGVGTHTITYSFTDGNGCSNTATADIIVDGCVSIEEISITEIKVYPNPTENNLTIELSGDFNFEIVDARGRLIQNGNGSDLVKINTSAFDAGVYFVNVTTISETATIRVVKK